MYIMSSDSSTATSTMLYTGRVKWFNNKAGYGFITVVSTPEVSEVEKNTDVFAHHSSIQVSEEQYRYLVQGEYVQFSLTSMNEGEHKHQALAVSGIAGGNLLCETRNEVRSSAPRRPPSRSSSRPARSSSDRRPQYRGSGPRDSGRDDEEWVLTRRKTTSRRSEQSSTR